VSKTSSSAPLRSQLARFQDFAEAHLTLEMAVAGLAPEHRGVRPAGLPHSIWELVEHIRIAQRDLLDFCVAAEYEHRPWPEAYWPPTGEPPAGEVWGEALAAIREDREELRRLALDPALDLISPVPHATEPGQTYLRALLLAQDHASYHIGQIVQVRRLVEG